MKRSLTALLLLLSNLSFAQSNSTLSVEKIMRDPKWIGSSPSSPFWNEEGTKLYFQWNPNKNISDSLYSISISNRTPQKVEVIEKKEIAEKSSHIYNQQFSAYVTTVKGDIVYADAKTGVKRFITKTIENESSPLFSFNETKIVYTRNQNLYSWDIKTGETEQLTNVKTQEAAAPASNGRNNSVSNTNKTGANQQEQWLQKDQLQYFQVLRERKRKRQLADDYNKSISSKEMRSIPLDDKYIQGLSISPDGRFITYRLYKQGSGKNTIIPNYVTESGFTTDINGRTKVGTPQSSSELFIYDRIKDTIIAFNASKIPGIEEIPSYLSEYPTINQELKKKTGQQRSVYYTAVSWSPKSNYFVTEIHANDNKDRWLMKWNTSNDSISLLDRQHDEAWIGGPGTSGWDGSKNIGWIDDNTFYYRSEQTGYSHLYTCNVNTNEKKALTSGNYEVQQADLSRNKKFFYLITNEVHPGEQQFYRLTIADGKKERITTMTGANQVSVSPDEKYIAILYSAPTEPWELFLQENKVGGKIEKLTNKAKSEEFSSINWQAPELINFTARDGATVYARVYKPKDLKPGAPAVLFVHGAGYLQNAHKWWSSYFREFMFNNMLAQNGYFVMDIDYRGSAGYGRDWRTGIYRHMGGKDLTDNIDGVNYLVKQYRVDAGKVGLYGGSYGGFITLMGMFNAPEKFAAGAALRPVTDWANYNHGYTSNILNEPFLDSIAYKRSSPFYFAEGLKGHLLICHGMVDVNVHYQDAVKLTQRLIELGKDNWELASYPMEDHGFIEPSSWTDEYKRIFKLFESNLKK